MAITRSNRFPYFDLGISESLEPRVGRPLGYNPYQHAQGLDYSNAGAAAQTLNTPGGRINTAGNASVENPAVLQERARTANLTGGGGGGGTQQTLNAPDPFDPFQALRDAAFARYQAGLGQAESAFGQAQNTANQSRELLGQRRNQFGEQLETGKQDIFDTYNTGRQNLQATSRNAATNTGNALRALGMGGSALVRNKGRQAQDNAQALGGLDKDRSLNERQNQDLFNERDIWANQQESGIDNYLRSATDNLNSARGFNWADYLENVGGIDQNVFNLASQIMQRQQDINALSQGTSAYQANPFQASLGDMTSMLNTNPFTMFGGQQQEENVSINPNAQNEELLRLMRR